MRQESISILTTLFDFNPFFFTRADKARQIGGIFHFLPSFMLRPFLGIVDFLRPWCSSNTKPPVYKGGMRLKRSAIFRIRWIFQLYRGTVNDPWGPRSSWVWLRGSLFLLFFYFLPTSSAVRLKTEVVHNIVVGVNDTPPHKSTIFLYTYSFFIPFYSSADPFLQLKWRELTGDDWTYCEMWNGTGAWIFSCPNICT